LKNYYRTLACCRLKYPESSAYDNNRSVAKPSAFSGQAAFIHTGL